MNRLAGLCVAAAVCAGAALAAPPSPDCLRVRLLYGFEDGTDGSPIPGLLKGADRIDIQTTLDNGVTEGRHCARLTIPKGKTGYFFLEPDRIKEWADFDYFAMDVCTEDGDPANIILELWDAGSANGEYHSRCTFENVRTHPGRQTLLYKISRSVRNGKQEWDDNQLSAKDRVDRSALTRVKVFTTARPDRDAVLWIDNLRLMQEDAAKPKMNVFLPEGAIAFKFGRAGDAMAGFKTITPATAFSENGPGFLEDRLKGLAAGGEGWPDPLTGTFVFSPGSEGIGFAAAVPDGEYLVWLAADRIIRSGLPRKVCFLHLNDQEVGEWVPMVDEVPSEKNIYRFLWTQYSQKPHALWRDYIDRMYPQHKLKVRVKDGHIGLIAVNCFLSAMILLPADRPVDFDKMVADIERVRIETFERTLHPPVHPAPQRKAGDPPFALFVPEPWRDVMPWTEPTVEQRTNVALDAAGAAGQNVVLRLAVMPFVDLGRCELRLSDLKGPGTIPASAIKGHFENYRFDGTTCGEMVLLPSLNLQMEQGITQCFWLWMKVPDDAVPGLYKGTFTFQPGSGKPVEIPVRFEVYPFKLEPVLPVSFSMYYRNARQWPPFAAGQERQRLKEQFEWMRRIGFTAAEVDVPQVTSLAGRDKVELQIDRTRYELAREVGMARCPEQAMLAVWLQVGRQVGRLLPGMGAKVDREPGCELRQPQFAGYYLDACRQYRAFLDKIGVPVALEVVDEPREVPNPWNRNLLDTIRYSNLLRQVKDLTLYVSPMRDENNGKDYTVLVDHFDILSLHAYDKSAGIFRKTLRTPGKRLWIYNAGKDRFSWGYYVWRAKATGRWEWNFCWPEDRAVGGYPGREWYNPFTELDGLAPYAPEDYPGSMLYKSCYLDIAEGINDYAYLYTLSRTIDAAEKAHKHADVVAEAKAFLASLDKQIPEFLPYGNGPEITRTLQTGEGLADSLRKMDTWRRTIAKFIVRLQ